MRYRGMDATDKRLFVASCLGAGKQKLKWLLKSKQQTLVIDRAEESLKVAWMTRSPRSQASLLVSLYKPASQVARQPEPQ